MLVRDQQVGRGHDLAGLEPVDAEEVVGPPPRPRRDGVAERPVRSRDDRRHDSVKERIVNSCRDRDGNPRWNLVLPIRPSTGRAGLLNPEEIEACSPPRR